jgi:hypothetical protein
MKWAAQWTAVVVVSFGALVLALAAPAIIGHQIVPGEVAEHDYAAKQKTYIVDLEKTRQAQEQARQTTMPILKRDQSAESENLHAVANAVAGPDGDKLAKRFGVKVSDWRSTARSAAERYIKDVDLVPGESKQHWQNNFFEYLPDSWSADLRSATAALVIGAMRPDFVVDAEATQQLLKEKTAHTQPITKQIESGTIIVQRGERLSPDDVMMLNQAGITHTHDFGNAIAITTALLAAFCLFGIFLYTYEPQYFFSPSAIALMATVCVVTSGIAAGVGKEYPQFVPLPAAALVLAVIFGRRTALMLAVLVILFFHVGDLLDSAHLVALAAASGIALGASITKRRELMLTGVLIGLVQAIAYFVAVMFAGMPGSALGVGKELAQNVLGGLSSSIVAIGSLPFLEIIFGILTPFRVAELSEPDQPLLRMLEENAPGTYQHSLAVANLAEAGAKAISADVNLVRAGAMYHDIGKMVTPRYFIENQLGDKNPHDEITPEESRAKVLAHVTNGLDLARKYGLPKQIQDFIPEHQGTTIMAYFYHKACVRDGLQNVNEKDYRYPGPKPQTKETAIVMLADVSEAVTHSMHEPTQEEVEAAIGNVFKARWDDGQFSESDLTAEELEKVKQAFVRVWRTLHHERLKYPATTTGRMPVPPPLTGSTAASAQSVVDEASQQEC